MCPEAPVHDVAVPEDDVLGVRDWEKALGEQHAVLLGECACFGRVGRDPGLHGLRKSRFDVVLSGDDVRPVVLRHFGLTLAGNLPVGRPAISLLGLGLIRGEVGLTEDLGNVIDTEMVIFHGILQIVESLEHALDFALFVHEKLTLAAKVVDVGARRVEQVADGVEGHPRGAVDHDLLEPGDIGVGVKAILRPRPLRHDEPALLPIVERAHGKPKELSNLTNCSHGTILPPDAA